MIRWSQPVGLPGLAALAVGGLAFVLCLLVARRRLRPDAGGGRRDRASLGWIVVQGLGVFAAAFGPIRVVLDPLGPPALAEAALVALLMAGCVGLFAAANRVTGRNWAVVAQTRSDHQLVTTGPFARVRNPIYLALFLLLLAFAIAYGHWLQLIVAVPLYWLGTRGRVGIEERLLRAQFGAAYDTYAAAVPRFVPRLSAPG